jgi:hypothetical protein
MLTRAEFLNFNRSVFTAVFGKPTVDNLVMTAKSKAYFYEQYRKLPGLTRQKPHWMLLLSYWF